jgi:uncharacterized membrane protein YdjX (TVP38/TMEM64 family)
MLTPQPLTQSSVQRHHTPVIAMPTAAVGPSPSSSSTWKKLTLGAVLGGVVVLFFLLDLDRYFTLEALKANRDRLLASSQEHYTVTVAAYIATYCLVVALSLPGAAILTLAGGFLFGPLAATVFVNIGATTGSTLAFLAARYLLRDWVEAKFGRWLAAVQKGFETNGFTYLLTLRLIPIFPFFVVNLLAGLTRISLRGYVAATAIGIVPGTFVYAYAGRQIGTINTLSEIATPRVVLAFVMLALLALLPLGYRKLRSDSKMEQGRP